MTPMTLIHHSVDLNFSTALNSISTSSFLTANISAQDFPVFTTDSQSTWLPNSASALPAPSEHLSLNPVENPQQDFVLFDNPQPRQHNRSIPLPSQRRHSCHTRREKHASHAVQNQRVAQILQAIGHPSLSSAYGNRLSNQFYASSAPSSTVSLNRSSRTARPPVPLFNQNAGNQNQTAKMMNAAGLCNPSNLLQLDHFRSHSPTDVDLDDFTFFEGGASTAFSSPAVASNFDFSSGASSAASNLGTVSPQDLLIQEPFMSAPNSAALTALTSPSLYNGSPEFDSYDVSPNFGNAEFENGPSDAWYSLFPSDAGSQELANASESPAQKPLESEPMYRSSSSGSGSGSGSGRKKSSGSPTGSTRHSSVSGVNSRRRDKPLPPIIVEDANDTVAMKRARNTLAARKSRERKAQRFEELEERIAKLEAERDHWKRIALSQSGALSE
ncbi:hypothetical protein M431DRAFT_550313 [Trichoderma harzianum CBS 226.95]|uniref:Cross-pathway control protein 1 n=1 Tax=Trichoderma harzianum CBS 226.95 TaxID=983964 RepID=A0A2T4AGQ3_TRIHA|nr:hypothetical protein M431DRAFT_550313 [Trichoderma harzianum CBS 226.95]PTB56264.1 hypothetical protein M431DRAFT_550313 [Trichoderma harzianum CBS 226.95]